MTEIQSILTAQISVINKNPNANGDMTHLSPARPPRCRFFAPYRCRLATASTSVVRWSAARRSLLRWPLPTAFTGVPPNPPAVPPELQLFSSWSPILRRREANR